MSKNIGQKFKPLRWTISRAASEFDISRSTLAKRMRAQGITGGTDKLFSTLQIASAVFSSVSLNAERLRKLTLEADILSMDKKEREKKLVPTDKVLECWGHVLILLRQKILQASKLTQDEQREILADMQQIPIGDYFKDAPLVEEVEG
jgi:hypothetical protein